MILIGKEQELGENLSHCHVVHHNPTWTVLGVNPDFDVRGRLLTT
jgi:hypothetical protein